MRDSGSGPHIPVMLAAAFLGLFAAASPAAGQSRLVFPRILFQEGRWSGIAIANPGAAAAAVTISSFNPDGSAFVAPVSFTVNAGAQYADLAAKTLGVPPSTSQTPAPRLIWLLATSPADGLTGFYLEGNDRLDFMDGAALEGNGTDLFLPLVENRGDSTTEMSLVNPDDTEEAAVTIDFIQDDGKTFATRAAKVPKSGALSGPLSDLFPASYSTVTALRIRGDRPLTCQATIRRASDNSQVTIAAIDAVLPAKLLAFPQLAQGAEWSTALGLANLGTEAVVATITAYRPDGSIHSAPTVSENPVARLIPAGGILRGRMADLFGFKDPALQQGWLKAEAVKAALAGYVEYGAGTNRAVVPAREEGMSSSLFSHQALEDPYFTGLAVLNNGSLAANIEIVSTDGKGEVKKAQRLIRPGRRESMLIQQWIPSMTEVTGGSVFVRSDTPAITTQLFGTRKFTALANVPPQAVPAAFNPGASTPTLTVTPPLAVVETRKTQKFVSSGAPSVLWRVNGIPGGNSVYGTISGDGSYAAPAVTPDPPTVTVEAVSAGSGQAAGATLDVVQRETLTQGLTLVTAVAYLESLERFFVAEQTALASAPGGRNAASADTRITETKPTGAKETFTTIPGDSIGKMLPFEDGNGVPYLLLAGTASGKIYRLAVDAGRQLVTVEQGLASPVSMALDPVSGDLLVSVADEIAVVPRDRFDPTASAGNAVHGAAAPENSGSRASISVARSQGIVFDLCTGTLYALTADGRLIQVQGNRQRTLLGNLSEPRQLLALYRPGSPCEDGLALLIAEASRVLLVRPKEGRIIPFIPDAAGIIDLAFFPQSRPFLPGASAAIILAERRLEIGGSRILRIPVGSAFDNRPLLEAARAGSALPLRDPAGDTFQTDLTGELGLRTPELVAINAQAFPEGVAIGMRFARPVAPMRLQQPNSLAGFIDFDYQPGGFPSHVEQYHLFDIPGRIGMDAYVDLVREVLVTVGASIPVPVRYQRDVVVVWIPNGLFDTLRARIGIVVGNRAEMTDVAPNAGLARISP